MILTRLKNDAGLVALVPASQIDPAGTPTWPFITIEAPITRRLRMSCVRGGLVSFDLHAFARARESGGVAVETARDFAGSIGAEIERILGDTRMTLENGAVAKVTLGDIRLLADGDQDSYHWFCQVNCRVLAQ